MQIHFLNFEAAMIATVTEPASGLVAGRCSHLVLPQARKTSHLWNESNELMPRNKGVEHFPSLQVRYSCMSLSYGNGLTQMLRSADPQYIKVMDSNYKSNNWTLPTFNIRFHLEFLAFCQIWSVKLTPGCLEHSTFPKQNPPFSRNSDFRCHGFVFFAERPVISSCLGW